MTDRNLTLATGAATHAATQHRGHMMKRGTPRVRLALLGSIGLLGLGSAGLGGCINVAAPEEPIVIELNINITAEVLYRLADDAGNTIDENADIF